MGAICQSLLIVSLCRYLGLQNVFPIVLLPFLSSILSIVPLRFYFNNTTGLSKFGEFQVGFNRKRFRCLWREQEPIFKHRLEVTALFFMSGFSYTLLGSWKERERPAEMFRVLALFTPASSTCSSTANRLTATISCSTLNEIFMVCVSVRRVWNVALRHCSGVLAETSFLALMRMETGEAWLFMYRP